MEINDIVPIYRIQHKGPCINNQSIYQLLEVFLLGNQSIIEDIEKKVKKEKELTKVMLFLEGAMFL